MKGSKQDNTLVEFDGATYQGIESIGFNDIGILEINLWTTKPGEQRGKYCTFLVVCRFIEDGGKIYETHSSYKVLNKTELVLHDAWGRSFAIKVKPPIIDQLVQECIDHQIPEYSN